MQDQVKFDFDVFNLPHAAPDEVRKLWIANIMEGRPGVVCMSARALPDLMTHYILILVFSVLMILLMAILVAIEGRYGMAHRTVLPAIVQAINAGEIMRPVCHPRVKRGAVSTQTPTDASKNYYKGLIDSLLK